MRVAQVITLFLPEFVGGATLACVRIAEGLRARGHDVAVFSGSPAAEAAPSGVRTRDVDGLPVTTVDAASGYVALDPRGYRHPELTAHFDAFLDRARPDVVHVHSIQALGATVIEAARARGIPVVVTMHDWWWFCVRLFLVDPEGFVCAPRVDSARCHCAPGVDLVTRRRQLDATLASVARVLTPSRTLAASAVANGVPAARVEVCPNGVDLPPATVRRRAGPVRFGYFGGPDNRLKGLPTLLDAAARLGVGGWTLRLFGVPHAEATVRTVIGDRVAVAPAFAPAALANVLARLDCLVVPSLMRESYSLVTREALAAGVPVIASDSGGPQEILVDGENGATFSTGDPADLAARMRRFVLDAEYRGRLATGAARTRVPSMAEQLDQLERVYRDAATSEHDARGVAAVVAPQRDGPSSATAGERNVAVAMAPLRRVLFVSGIDGAPFRYRVTHLREQLRLRGIASTALYYTDPAVLDAVADADVVVAYRVPMSTWVARWIEGAGRLDRPVVFGCDDLVFDASAVPEDALALLPEPQRAGWRAYVARYAETLAACDAFLGSTEPLVDAAARLGVPGRVVPNGLGARELAVAETSRHAAPRRTGRIRVAYLSGTIMHDLDFALIEPALADLLAAEPSVDLVLVGYLRTGAPLAPFAHRIERLPFLPWPRLFEVLAGVDVSLAPLRRDRFSDAKSAVKYLEAGAVAVPTIASASPAFDVAIRSGENGLLAANRRDWDASLRALVRDGGLRRRLGNAALADVVLHSGPEAQADAFVAALEHLRTECARVRADTTTRADGSTHVRIGHGGHDDACHSASADDDAETGRYDLEPDDDALPDATQLARDGSSPVLTAGRTVGQLFRATSNGLCRIDVCVGTDGARDAPALAVHLVRVTAGVPLERAIRGVDVVTLTLAGGAIADDAWLAAKFAPISNSAGATFYVWITRGNVTSSAREPSITLRTYTAGWGETPPTGLHIDHRPMPGSLAYRTFAKRDPAA